MSEQPSSLVIQGVPDNEDITTLLNTRNFDYYCAARVMIINNECPFCDPDPAVNKIIAENDTWQMWDCPLKFRAKDLSSHKVLTPKRQPDGSHNTHHGYLSEAQWKDFRSILLKEVFPKLSGPLMLTSVGSPFAVLSEIHAEIVVPDKTMRVVANFNANFIDNEPTNKKTIRSIGSWALLLTNETGLGINQRYLIVREPELANFSGFNELDLEDIFSLFQYAGDELGCGLTGGTFLMGLPGAALTMRFGDPALNAGSIRHLHCNIKWPADHLVSETLAKNPVDVEAKKTTVALWEKMRLYVESHDGAKEQDAFDALDPEEQLLLSKKK